MSIMAFLPKSKWRSCRRCGGSGSYEQSRDAHRSGGIVPCDCGNGYEKYDAVTPEEYDRRSRAGELADHKGDLQPPAPTRYGTPEPKAAEPMPVVHQIGNGVHVYFRTEDQATACAAQFRAVLTPEVDPA